MRRADNSGERPNTQTPQDDPAQAARNTAPWHKTRPLPAEDAATPIGRTPLRGQNPAAVPMAQPKAPSHSRTARKANRHLNVETHRGRYTQRSLCGPGGVRTENAIPSRPFTPASHRHGLQPAYPARVPARRPHEEILEAEKTARLLPRRWQQAGRRGGGVSGEWSAADRVGAANGTLIPGAWPWSPVLPGRVPQRARSSTSSGASARA